mgnify:CR=1 FL=1
MRDITEAKGYIPESQIYNWGIKKGASLGGVRPAVSSHSYGASSDVPIDNIHQAEGIVNPSVADGIGTPSADGYTSSVTAVP